MGNQHIYRILSLCPPLAQPTPTQPGGQQDGYSLQVTAEVTEAEGRWGWLIYVTQVGKWQSLK